MKTTTIVKLLLLLVLATGTAGAYAQNSVGILGRIETVMLDDGYIVIDGKRMAVRAAELVITYKGEPFRSSFLSSGQSVRYKTRADGSVSELMLIGPAAELDKINNQ